MSGSEPCVGFSRVREGRAALHVTQSGGLFSGVFAPESSGHVSRRGKHFCRRIEAGSGCVSHERHLTARPYHSMREEILNVDQSDRLILRVDHDQLIDLSLLNNARGLMGQPLRGNGNRRSRSN